MQQFKYSTTLEQSTPSPQHLEDFSRRIKPLLEKIYDDQQTVDRLVGPIFSLLQEHFADSVTENLAKWSQNEILMITYGDSICAGEEKPLVTLRRFLSSLHNTITGVHLLPFFPSSADDGFALSIFDSMPSAFYGNVWELPASIYPRLMP